MPTEHDRMLAGAPYDARDPELLGRYHHVRQLLAVYAAIPSTDADRKRDVLGDLLGHVGDGVWVEAPFFCDYGTQIRLGEGVFINYNCVFLDSNPITVGAHTLIGPAVQIYTATHPLAASERLVTEARGTRYLTQAKPVTIGERCWIGGGALVLPGVTIGEGTTIGAGSVVTASVPAGVFAAGNPCRVLRTLEEADHA